MFGIGFVGHPDLRNMYLPTDFEGFPMRKDFAVLPFIPNGRDVLKKIANYIRCDLFFGFQIGCQRQFLANWKHDAK